MLLRYLNSSGRITVPQFARVASIPRRCASQTLVLLTRRRPPPPPDLGDDYFTLAAEWRLCCLTDPFSEITMRRVRYSVAMSLDGYIAGPNGEADWIIMDPDIDFEAYMNSFDTFLMGRRTFEAAGGGTMSGTNSVVVSRTLRPEDYPNVTILGDGWEEAVSRLRAEPGKDIWLFGGGSLFRSLLQVGLVDTVEVGIVPVLLGEGTPLLPPPGERVRLRLTGSRVYEKTGIVSLEYAVEAQAA